MKSMNVQIYSTNNTYNTFVICCFYGVSISGVKYNYRLRKFEKNVDKKTSIIINACFFVLYELLINKFVNYHIINRKQNNTNHHQQTNYYKYFFLIVHISSINYYFSV